MMQKFFLFCLCGVLFSTHQLPAQITAPKVKKSSYPSFVEVVGTVEDIKSTGATAVHKKTLIVDRLNLVVKPGSSVKLQLDDKRSVRAFAGTEFEIPSISWETRQFSEIILKKGALRFEIEAHPFAFTLKSPLFELVPPVGETVLRVDPATALAEAFVLKGEMEFRALNAEESVKLTAGQKVYFSGLLEEGEISYDLLLQGKKIPKGRLGQIETLTLADQQLYSQESEKKVTAQRLKKETEQRKKQQLVHAQSLCHKPKGQLNDCHWKMQGKECVRTRCVADGKWKDLQKVDVSQCSSVSVKACNY